jgi:hypothetical protein
MFKLKQGRTANEVVGEVRHVQPFVLGLAVTRSSALFFFGDVLSVTVKPLTSRCTQIATYVPLRVDESPTSLMPMSDMYSARFLQTRHRRFNFLNSER